MSTPTPAPVDAKQTSVEGNERSRLRLWWRIALATLALFAVGGATWRYVDAPRTICSAATAANPARAGAVTEYCLPGRFQSFIGGAMTVGPDGNLWVAYSTRGSIARVTPQGVLTEFTVSPPPSAPALPGITRGPDGNLWYIAAGKLVRMNTRGEIVGLVTPPADMAKIGGITTGSDGAIWIINYVSVSVGSDKIAKMAPTGQFTEHPLPSGMAVVGMAAGSDGDIWMANAFASNIERITPDGVITQFPSTTDSQLGSLTTGPDGNIWFIDVSGHVDCMTPTGRVTVFTVASPQNSRESAIGAGPDGNVWFAAEPGKIGRITPTGVVTQFALPRRGDIGGITPGPDGGVWFLLTPTDFPASLLQPARLVRVTP